MIRLVGIVEVALDRLRVLELGQRIYDPGRCDYLTAVFSGHQIDSDRPNNQIDGIILEENLQEILLGLRLPLERLKATLSHGPYPQIYNHDVYYIQGRHRIEAAKRSGDVLKWIVRLYVTDSWSNFIHNETVFIQTQTDWYSHEKEWSDGDIYIKLREAQVSCNADIERQFTVRLGPMKRKSMADIEARPQIQDTLDRFKRFPGLLHGLKLGMVYKYLSWHHLDQEVTKYMQHIEQVYVALTDGGEYVQQSMDISTIRTLEGRLPANVIDRQIIQRGFRSGKLFSMMTDEPWRARIEHNILNLPVLIPSLKSFHEYMKILSTAARIVKIHLLSDHTHGKGTLQQQLRKYWDPSARLVIEISEGKFQYGMGPSSFEVAYIHLMLAAIRQFPYLQQTDSPRVSSGKSYVSHVDVACQSLFYRRAHLLGFRNHAIAQGCLMQTQPFEFSKGELPLDEEAHFLTKVDRRWGRPHTQIFGRIQHILFLPRLTSNEGGDALSVIRIQKDFINAFFGLPSFCLDTSIPMIDINTETMAGCPRSVPMINTLDFRRPRGVEGFIPHNFGDLLMSGTVSDEDQTQDIVMQDMRSEKSSSSGISEMTMKWESGGCSEIAPLKFPNGPLPMIQTKSRQPKPKLLPETPRNSDRINANFLPQVSQLERISSVSMPFSMLGHTDGNSSSIESEPHGRSFQASLLSTLGEIETVGRVHDRDLEISSTQISQPQGYRIPGTAGWNGHDLRRISSPLAHQSMMLIDMSPNEENGLKRMSSLQSDRSPISSDKRSSGPMQMQRISSSLDMRSTLPSYRPWQDPVCRVKHEHEEMAIDSTQTRSQWMDETHFSSSLSRVQSGDTKLSDQHQGYNFNANIDSSDPFSFNGSSITTRSTLLSFPGDRVILNHGLDGIQGFDDSEDSMIF